MSEALIELHNITFTYPGASRPIFQDFHYQLLPGEHIGLTGPNGSGKTTLLYLIMGLLRPQAGSIVILGQEIKKEKDFADIRQKVGLLFQNADDQLFCPTVLEDVAFGPLNQGKPPVEAITIARETMARLGLDGFEDRVTY
jgi:cobalt/nickel transport system ATP-binding protein